MKDAVKQLAQTRQTQALHGELLAQREVRLHATPEWKQWELASQGLRIAKANVADAEAAVRERAVGIYAKTGDKAPHGAVKIKIYTVLDYGPADALDYAREHLPQALKLVKRTFEQAAKVLELDFVTITQEPRATIARDLSEYLPED